MKTKLLFLAFLTSLLSWGQIFESFESGLPTSYTSTLSNVTLGSGTWQIDDVVQGTTGVQTGSYSAQIKSAIGAQIITPTLTGGVGVISFYVTASTTSGAYQVNLSTDDGVTWSPATGSPFTISTTKTLRSITINNSAVNKIQIYRTGATIYIDDFNTTTYSSGPAPILAITPATTNLGTSCVGTPTTAVTYTITNSGTVDATGVTVMSSGTHNTNFVVSGLSSTTIPASGGTATYVVTFTPSAVGARNATITVASTTSGSNSPSTALTGTGNASIAQAVTSGGGATAVLDVSATLNGRVSTLGTFEINTLQKNKAPLIIQVTLENGKKITKKLIF